MGGGAGGGGGGGSPVDHTRLMHKRKAARKAEEGFRRMEHEDDAYGPAGRGGAGGRPLARELGFLEKVKQRLRNREQYSDFLKVGGCLCIIEGEQEGEQECRFQLIRCNVPVR
jgi:hypothetical protein